MVVFEELRERRAQAPPAGGDDIFWVLERAHIDSGGPASEQKMRDELVTMLSDGPIAISLARVFDAPAALSGQGRGCVGSARRRAGIAESVVKETLRLCPGCRW